MKSSTIASRTLVAVIIIVAVLFSAGWVKSEYAEKHTWEYQYKDVGLRKCPGLQQC